MVSSRWSLLSCTSSEDSSTRSRLPTLIEEPVFALLLSFLFRRLSSLVAHFASANFPYLSIRCSRFSDMLEIEVTTGYSFDSDLSTLFRFERMSRFNLSSKKFYSEIILEDSLLDTLLYFPKSLALVS